jgi:hypothetical protein
MSAPLVYLELLPDVGIAPPFITGPDGEPKPNPRAGQPEPLNNIGIPVSIPQEVEGLGVVDQAVRVTIAQAPQLGDPKGPPVTPKGVLTGTRIIPGTRTLESRQPAVVAVLLETGHYQPCDPPKSGEKKEG